MQKRSLNKIYVYSTLSLGIYQLVWLYQTRRELSKLSTVRIPSVGWLALLQGLQLAAIILGIALVSMLASTGRSAPVVSSSCWSNYVIATAPETAGQTRLSNACRDDVERSNAALNRQDKLIKGYIVVIVLLFVSWLGYPRWLRNYALAVQQVTQGKFSQTATMFMLAYGSAFGMAAVQDEFNRTDVSALSAGVSVQTPYKSTENKTVHRVLSVIAFSMVTVFALLIVFLVAVSYYGTHFH